MGVSPGAGAYYSTVTPGRAPRFSYALSVRCCSSGRAALIFSAYSRAGCSSSYGCRGPSQNRSPSRLFRGITCRCRCGTDWLTTLLTRIIEPSAPSPSSTARSSRCAVVKNSGTWPAGRSLSSRMCCLGTSSTCPWNSGRWSRNAISRSVSSTVSAGCSPRMMAQKTQAAGTGTRRAYPPYPHPLFYRAERGWLLAPLIPHPFVPKTYLLLAKGGVMPRGRDAQALGRDADLLDLHPGRQLRDGDGEVHQVAEQVGRQPVRVDELDVDLAGAHLGHLEHDVAADDVQVDVGLHPVRAVGGQRDAAGDVAGVGQCRERDQRRGREVVDRGAVGPVDVHSVQRGGQALDLELPARP